MMIRIKAEENINSMEIISIGTGNMDKKYRKEIVHAWFKNAGFNKQRRERQKTEPEKAKFILAQMGVTVG